MRELYGLIDVDLDFYRGRYRDLQKFDDAQLLRHYYKYGYTEGRISHPRARRENMVTAIGELKSLEIGPFVSPKLLHDNVKYLDVLTTDELMDRAKKLGKPTDGIRPIDFVARDGSLREVSEKFDLVFSSHNLEHQPDPISHLNEVAEVLNDDGIFAMMVPDARYCFDAHLPLSKISNLFDAHLEKRNRHTLGSIVEHRAMITHNDAKRHWEESSIPSYKRLDTNKISSAIGEFHRSAGSYIDVHAWQFEPLSLSDILGVLIELGFLPFRSVSCRGPVKGRNEFSVELTK